VLNTRRSALPEAGSKDWKAVSSLQLKRVAAGGRYFNTPNFIFSSRWAGSLDPTEAANFAVKDGIFAWRQVGKFNWEVYREYASIYNGSLSTGLLRSPTSTLNNTYVTRFPLSNLFKKNSSVSKKSAELLLLFVEYARCWANGTPSFLYTDTCNKLQLQHRMPETTKLPVLLFWDSDDNGRYHSAHSC
jgi:hypothetical protein